MRLTALRTLCRDCVRDVLSLRQPLPKLALQCWANFGLHLIVADSPGGRRRRSRGAGAKSLNWSAI
jgi:hypothetical protein